MTIAAGSNLRNLHVLFLLVAFTSCRAGDKEEAERASLPDSVPGSTRSVPLDSWAPQGTWKAYGTVFIKATADSSGHVTQAEVLHSYAPPAQTDSVLELARKARFDLKITEGRVSPWGPSTDRRFLIPYTIPQIAMKPAEPLPATREELERAGLRDWLAIWDALLPAWPVETWAGRWGNRFYEYPPEHEIDDTDFMRLDMVSVSPDGNWHLHPFYGAGVNDEGRIGFDADSGYVLYRTVPPQRGRQYVAGTLTAYSSAEWIDSKRFVLAATTAAEASYGGTVVSYRAPMLCFGHVDSLNVTCVTGPPVPIESMTSLRARLDGFTRDRYPEFWAATR